MAKTKKKKLRQYKIVRVLSKRLDNFGARFIENQLSYADTEDDHN